MENVKIFACNSATRFGIEVCYCLGVELGKMKSFKFKNDNNFVQLEESVRDKDVYIIQTTELPVNERIMELLIAIETAKRASAKRVTAVLPYFMYSRSDKKDQPRVPITAKLMAKLIETAGADRVITCDLHNAAIQGYFEIGCDVLSASYLLTDYFKSLNLENPVVVATDAGSTKKAYKYSKFFGCPIAMIDKRREDNNDNAKANRIVGDIKGKTCLIFDDEISTGGTLVEAINICKDSGAKEVWAGATHAIFAGDAVQKIRNSCVNKVVVTNTVPYYGDEPKIEVLSIAPLFADAIKRVHKGEPLGDLFLYDK